MNTLYVYIVIDTYAINTFKKLLRYDSISKKNSTASLRPCNKIQLKITELFYQNLCSKYISSFMTDD